MIMSGWLVLVPLAVLAAGCARSTAEPAAKPSGVVNAVPAGCSPSQDGVEWSGVVLEPVLEHVALFTGDQSGTGRSLVDAPVTAAVTGLSVPDTWLPLLGASLAETAGTDVHTVRPTSEYGFGFPGTGSGGGATIVYLGSRRISATFTIGCTPAVSGTFVAWTETTASGLSCGDPQPSADLYQQAARKYCPSPGPGGQPSESGPNPSAPVPAG